MSLTKGYYRFLCNHITSLESQGAAQHNRSVPLWWIRWKRLVVSQIRNSSTGLDHIWNLKGLLILPGAEMQVEFLEDSFTSEIMGTSSGQPQGQLLAREVSSINNSQELSSRACSLPCRCEVLQDQKRWFQADLESTPESKFHFCLKYHPQPTPSLPVQAPCLPHGMHMW